MGLCARHTIFVDGPPILLGHSRTNERSSMLKRVLLPVLLAGIIGVAVVSEVVSSSSAGTGYTTVSSGPAVAAAASPASETAKATNAANAFLKTLSSAERAKVEYPFGSSAKKSGWSNLPTTFVKRNGDAIADLSSKQVATLQKLLKTALSAQGYTQEEATRVADEYLSENGGGSSYGSGLYSAALFGIPSTPRKWTFEFGGHHLAIHVTFAGAKISGTPYFVGVEPTSFVVASKSYAPMAQKSGAMVALFSSLSDSEKAAAQLSQWFDDVLLGPGQDGKFPAAQGQLVSDLDASQQALVTKAIEARVGDVNVPGASKLVATYKKQYAQTRIAWSTSLDPSVQGAYYRNPGPAGLDRDRQPARGGVPRPGALPLDLA
jgi:hypothetical protein